jgi:cell division protein FtsL
MTPEEKSLLERTYKLAEDNNSILHSMRRTHRMGIALKVTYWAIIISVSFGLIYYLQPYFESLVDVIKKAEQVINEANQTANDLQKNVVQNVSKTFSTK